LPSFGSPHHHYARTDSTNDRARALIEAQAPSGTVITASEQTAGRGRLGRTWTAPPGKALLASFVLRPLEERHRLLPLAIPLAVCEAIEAVGPAECRIKWPNDVWIEGRKVAGVLVEARPAAQGSTQPGESAEGWAVIGVGVNVGIEPDDFPAELRDTATSIRGGNIEELLGRLCENLDRWVEAERTEVLTAFRERDALHGQPVAWSRAGDGASGAGTADGIGDDGNLLVVADSGERLSLGSGEVSLRLG
jgi:BirA family transcriptional regulator, biotin operon repressor / biotin---[acetyl-CoA-carboxylase] ligase